MTDAAEPAGPPAVGGPPRGTHDVPPEPRVGHRERQAVADRLAVALAEGRITPAEHEERAAAAYGARRASELARLTADLPDPSGAAFVGLPARAASPGPSPGGGTEVGWTVAVLGGADRRGRWRPAARSRALAVMGNCRLDLREAQLPPGLLDLTAVAVMGEVVVAVPEGVDVVLTGLAVMGSRSATVADVPVAPGSTTVRVHAVAVMGNVTVLSSPAGDRPGAPSPHLPPAPPRLGKELR